MTTLATIMVMLFGMSAALVAGFVAGIWAVTISLKTGRLISTEALKTAIKDDYHKKQQADLKAQPPTLH